MILLKTPRRHTHGASACNRSTGSFFIEQFAKGLARRVWFYQCSKSDQRNQRLGSRDYYWAKDLAAAPAAFMPQGGDLVAMVDVDQYVEMNDFCYDNFRPVILYTFQPSTVSRSTGEYSFTFDQDGEVEYMVSGGASYKHPVWNYNTDTIVVRKKFLGIVYAVATFNVDKRGMDEDHQLVLLTPLCKWWGLPALLACFLVGKSLDRLNPVVGSFLRLERHTKEGVSISTGRVGEHVACEIPSATDSYLASIARTSKVGLTLPQVKSRLPGESDGSAILYEYHLAKLAQRWPIVFPVESYSRSYQFNPTEYDPEAKQSLVSFMKPLLDGAFYPALTESNNRQAIVGRIEKVKNTTLLDQFMIKCVNEFVGLTLCQSSGNLVPYEPEMVYELQNRPSQRRILREAECMRPKRVAKSFMKREAYQKISDPRIITTINGVDKMDYSQFMYALADVVKRHDWYAFGKTPYDVSVRVCHVLSKAKTAVNTDFSRMDGHVSDVLRYLEKQIVLSAFKPEYSETIVDLMRSQIMLHGTMDSVRGDVVHYEQGLARASGSPETSIFNSIDNAFIAYLAFRMSRDEFGHYYDPRVAYSLLGIYGGDDGLTADIKSSVYVSAAKRCGQVLTAEVVERHTFGICFLSRKYGPDVWSGDLASMCDLPRTLSKFHVTTNLPSHITDIMKLVDKSYAYWLTDEFTPIIGPFVSTVKQLAGRNYQFKNISNNWNAHYEKDVQYVNEPRDWYSDQAVRDLPEYDSARLIQWLLSVTCLRDLLDPPDLHERIEPITVLPVVVDGDIRYPSPSPSIPSRPRSTGTVSSGPPRRTRLRVTNPDVTPKQHAGRKTVYKTVRNARSRSSTTDS